MCKSDALRIVCVVLLAGCAGKPVDVPSARLAACPKSFNCVSSLESDPGKKVEPLHYASSRAAARERLAALLKNMPRCSIVDMQTDRIRATFKTRFFKFVDDVDFYFDPDHPVIHVRSASRIGYYDFGANRRRVNTIHKLWTPLPEQP